LIQALKQFPIFPASTRLLGFRKLGEGGRLISAVEMSKGGNYFAFCGIGNPDGFLLDLKRWGLHIAGERTFRDHHRYTASEVREIEAAAERAGCKGLITTEKDLQNLSGIQLEGLALFVCAITLEIGDEQQFIGAIAEKLQGSRPA